MQAALSQSVCALFQIIKQGSQSTATYIHIFLSLLGYTQVLILEYVQSVKPCQKPSFLCLHDAIQCSSPAI